MHADYLHERMQMNLRHGRWHPSHNMKTIGQKNLHCHAIQLGQAGGFPRKLLKLDSVTADYTS